MTLFTTPRQWWREHLQTPLTEVYARIDDDLEDRTDAAAPSDDRSSRTTKAHARFQPQNPATVAESAPQVNRSA